MFLSFIMSTVCSWQTRLYKAVVLHRSNDFLWDYKYLKLMLFSFMFHHLCSQMFRNLSAAVQEYQVLYVKHLKSKCRGIKPAIIKQLGTDLCTWSLNSLFLQNCKNKLSLVFLCVSAWMFYLSPVTALCSHRKLCGLALNTCLSWKRHNNIWKRLQVCL